jgi:N-acetylmuramoyl-L-alanine amidase
MSSRVAGLVLCCGLAGLLAPAASPAAQLTQAELTERDGLTTVTLHFDSRPQPKLFTLDNPWRAVIDLRGIRSRSGLDLPGARGLVTRMRKGPLQGKAGLRLVLELTQSAKASPPRYLAPAGGSGHRLQVDLRAIGTAPAAVSAAATPAVAAIAPPSPRREQATVPVRAEHAPAQTGRDIIIAIDAGHGGQDPGATGKRGTYEKDVVLSIAKLLAARINAEPGMRAVLTRDGDYFLSLRERSARARRARADLFVSVHADAVRDREVSGASVYVLSEKGATDEQARWLADSENAADLKGGIPLDDKSDTLASVLLDLSQSASIAESMRAAERVLRTLGHVSDVRKKQVQQAGFVVLKSPDIPSMLVETAYISNPGDEADLKNPAHRERIAAAIHDGVRQYFVDHPPDGTQFALDRRRGVATAAR